MICSLQIDYLAFYKKVPFQIEMGLLKYLLLEKNYLFPFSKSATN